MNDIIVQTSNNVTLVGAGEASKAQLRLALGFAPYLVAADGGAELVLNYGKVPNNLIGDFDSVDKAVLQKIPEGRQFRVADQETTDFEKCLRAIDAPLILGVGFLGARLDHQLAALGSLIRCSHQRCVLLGTRDVILALHGPLELKLQPGTRLSLFPMAPVRGVSEGLEWPVDGIDFAPDNRVGTSNRVSDSPVRLNFADPGMLLILPLAALGAIVSALARH